jgi:hypothetical protein
MFIQQVLKIKMIRLVLILPCQILIQHRLNTKMKFSFFNINVFLQEDQYAFVQYELPDEELAIGKFE